MSPETNHHIPEEELSSYADGDLEPPDSERVADHIASCEACRELLDDLRATRSLLANLGRQTAPERFTRHVESRIRRRSRGRFFHNRWQAGNRTIYLGAAIVLVILAALYFFSQVAVQLHDADTGKTGDQLGREYDADVGEE